MSINSHLSTCVGTQSPKYLEMAQGHISLSDLPTNRHTWRIFRKPQQQQPEMDPPQPPAARVDPAVAAQMRIMQQLADTMADMQAQMRQERQEMR
jgi:hypothetical protein